jgi:putative methyltransferase (TIGR04325 family)
MRFLKSILKFIFSDHILSKITGIFYGWHGDYKSWEAAKSKCHGYDDVKILERVLESTIKVKNGEVPYERDSIVFRQKIYSFPVLAALMWIGIRNNNKLNVLDFGGSLGTSYFQNLDFLKSLSEINWCIVEQKHFVDEGKAILADKNLHFFYSINECISEFKINFVLLSSVIQYIEKPYDLINEIVSKDLDYIMIDRTLLINKPYDRLTIQEVPGKIYKASYCCWFLSKLKFMKLFEEKYELVYDFDIKENININSEYKGFLFRKKLEK